MTTSKLIIYFIYQTYHTNHTYITHSINYNPLLTTLPKIFLHLLLQISNMHTNRTFLTILKQNPIL